MAPVLGVCILLQCLVAFAMANSCPTWFTNSSGRCKCGHELNGYVKCNQDAYRVDVSIGWCITLLNNNSEDTVVAGACPYVYASNSTSRVYSSVPNDPTRLNAAICSPYNREGLFCGHCSEGFGPSPFFSKYCPSCSDMKIVSATSLYLFLEFFPITILFFVVVLFHLNVTSGPMLGYIIFCQAHVFTLCSNPFMNSSVLSNLPSPLVFVFHCSLVLSGMWTLRFFQFIVSPFCISDKMTDIHVCMLRFATALYPQFLALLTCIAMELHLQDCKYVSFIWKPLYKCLAKLNRKLNASNSIIHAFATFIFLSFFEIMYQTYTILLCSSVYNVNGSVITTVNYFDPTIVQYSSNHVPYMVISLFFLFFLVLCPAFLLCLYPTRLYQKLSPCVSSRKRIVVKIFVETFQGCFKDGLNDTKDYRMIPGIIFLCAALCAIVFPFTNSLSSHSPFSAVVVDGCLCVISVFLSYVRPCKTLLMNVSLSFHFILLGIAGIMINLWEQDSFISTETLAIAFAVLTAVPHTMMFIWATYNILSHIYTICQCDLERRVLKCSAWLHHRQHELLHLLPKERDSSQQLFVQ